MLNKTQVFFTVELSKFYQNFLKIKNLTGIRISLLSSFFEIQVYGIKCNRIYFTTNDPDMSSTVHAFTPFLRFATGTERPNSRIMNIFL